MRLDRAVAVAVAPRCIRCSGRAAHVGGLCSDCQRTLECRCAVCGTVMPEDRGICRDCLARDAEWRRRMEAERRPERPDESAREIAAAIARATGAPVKVALPPRSRRYPPRARAMPSATCPACGEKGTVPADADRCLECLAKASPRRNFSPAEKALIVDLAGREPMAAIQRALYTRCGRPRSIWSIKTAAYRLTGGIREVHAHLWRVAELAEQAQVSVDIVREAVRSGLIRSVGKAQVLLFDQAALDALAAVYPPPPAHAITTVEAARRLGYVDYGTIGALCRDGAIRAVLRGKVWSVDADHVAEIAAEWRRTGQVTGTWGLGEDPKTKARRIAQRERERAGTITFREAARRLGISDAAARLLLESGAIPCRREGPRKMRVDEATVADLAADRRALEALAAECGAGIRRAAVPRSERWYTATQAARMLGLRRKTMVRLIREGHVAGKFTAAGTWLAERAEVESLAANWDEGGRRV